MANQAIDFVDNSLPTAFDIYKVKCEALVLLDQRVKKLAQHLLELQNAMDQLELEINQGDTDG